MSIQLTPAPTTSTTATAQLTAADVQTLIGVLAPLLTLTPPQSLQTCVGANLMVRKDGAGVLSLRFNPPPAV